MMAYMYYVRDNVIRHELDLDCTLLNKVHCTHFLRTNPYYVSNYINECKYSKCIAIMCPYLVITI